MTIKEIARAIHENSINKGWYDEPRTFGDIISLCHSELSEALEEVRKGKGICETYFSKNGKPEGVPTELADCIIRIMDACEYYGIDIENAILEKHEYNKKRPYRHGGKVL